MHLNSSTVYAYSSRQTKSTKIHAKLYFALEQSKKVLFAMNVSCPTGVNATQLGLASLMTSGLMFGVFWKEDYLKDRGGPSLGRWVNSGIEDSLPGGVHSIQNTKKGLANNRFPRISLSPPANYKPRANNHHLFGVKRGFCGDGVGGGNLLCGWRGKRGPGQLLLERGGQEWHQNT